MHIAHAINNSSHFMQQPRKVLFNIYIVCCLSILFISPRINEIHLELSNMCFTDFIMENIKCVLQKDYMSRSGYWLLATG